MATFNHISGQEPSTVSFKLATVTQTRNSSVMHQELMVISDPDSSLANAAVLNTDPASTAWGLVVRDARYSTIVSVAALPANTSNVSITSFAAALISSGVPAAGSSGLVVQQVGYVAPSTTVTVAAMPANSSLVQISAFSAALISSAAPAGNSSALLVRVVGGASSAADFKVTATPVSTGWVKQAGFSVDSSNYLNVNASFTGSTIVTVSTIVGVVTVRPESTASAGQYLTVRLTDGSAFAALQADYIAESTLTHSTVAGPTVLLRASSSTPPPMSTSDQFVVQWATLNGAAVQTLVTSSGASVMDGSATPGVKVTPNSTAWVKNAGFSVDSSNYLNVNASFTGSTTVSIAAFPSGMVSTSTPAAGSSGLVVRLAGATVDSSGALLVSASFSGSTIVTVSAFGAGMISSGVPAAGTSGLVVQQVGYVAPSTTVSVAALPANSSQVEVRAFPTGVLSTATPATGSTGVNVYLANQSTIVTIAAMPANTSNVAVTAFPSGLISSGAASSGSSALNVRHVIDGIVTAASTSAFATSTQFTISASTAQAKYVTGYSFTSTDQTATVLRFMSGSTLLWPVRMIAVSSGLTGANMTCGGGGGGYLFKCNAASSLTLQINGSSRAGWTVGVSFYLAP